MHFEKVKFVANPSHPGHKLFETLRPGSFFLSAAAGLINKADSCPPPHTHYMLH